MNNINKSYMLRGTLSQKWCLTQIGVIVCSGFPSD
jgi:hypothetical protein